MDETVVALVKQVIFLIIGYIIYTIIRMIPIPFLLIGGIGLWWSAKKTSKEWRLVSFLLLFLSLFAMGHNFFTSY